MRTYELKDLRMTLQLLLMENFWVRYVISCKNIDWNTGKPVTGNTSKLAKNAIKIYRFTEGEIPVFSVKN
jgi:hypothetical protein